MTRKFYAHSLEERPPEEWQPLEEHLKNVAEIARGLAKGFGGILGACNGEDGTGIEFFKDVPVSRAGAHADESAS